MVEDATEPPDAEGPPAPPPLRPRHAAADRRERRTGRLGLLLALIVLLNAASTALLFRRHGSPESTLVVAAVGIAAVVAAGAALSGPRRRIPGALLLLLALVLVAGQAFNLASGTLQQSPAAAQHVFAAPRAILEDGRFDAAGPYALHPLSHLVLAEAHLLTGLGLWVAGAFLATALAAAAAALVMLAARSQRAGSELWAGTAFLAFPAAVAWGQSYAPLGLAAVFAAGLVYVASRRTPLAWAAGLMAASAAGVAASDPFAAALVAAAFLLAGVADAILQGPSARLVPAGAGVAVLVVYLVAATARGGPLADVAEYVGPRGHGGWLGLPVPPHDALTRALETVTFSLGAAAAVAGWLWVLWDRRGVLTRLQVTAFGFAVAGAVAAVFFLPVALRAAALLAVVAAPFAGWTLARLPRLASGATLATLVVLGLTAVGATHQLHPWGQGGTVVAWEADDAAAGSVVGLLRHARSDFHAPAAVDANGTADPNATAPPAESRLVSSHPLRYRGDSIEALPFSTRQSPAAPNAWLLVVRADAAETGYQVPFSTAPPEIQARATYFPTAAHGALLAASPRIAQYGPYAVYQP